uniref:Uncharacterized protein n=1 Tax=Panagrolaimus superbus TaxID=310955 RepID=A0A914Z734_9BILA
MNRDCFYLYVPEWRNFAQAYNNVPGQQGYQQQGYGTTNIYGQPQTPTNILNQQATGGVFSVGNNQFTPQGQINHQQTRLGQYSQQSLQPYGPGNGVNTIGGGVGGGAPGMSGFNTNYNEMNRNNINNNDYNNNNNNNHNNQNNQNGESRWINLSNVSGKFSSSNTTTRALQNAK